LRHFVSMGDAYASIIAQIACAGRPRLPGSSKSFAAVRESGSYFATGTRQFTVGIGGAADMAVGLVTP